MQAREGERETQRRLLLLLLRLLVRSAGVARETRESSHTMHCSSHVEVCVSVLCSALVHHTHTRPDGYFIS